MRETYTTPEIEVLYVSEDIITTSPLGNFNDNNPLDLPEMPW